MKPSFALDFRDGLVTLLHRTSRGWSQVGSTSLDAPDFAEALSYLRSTALGLSPRGITTKLVIPNEQVLYTQVQVTAPEPAKRKRQIKAALEGLTPYPVDDLAYDWTGTGTDVHVAVVARETLAEAEAFATEHRFNPVSFVAVPDNAAFVTEPFFGPTALSATLLAAGEKVERDADPVSVIARDYPRSEPARSTEPAALEPTSPEPTTPEPSTPESTSPEPATPVQVETAPLARDSEAAKPQSAEPFVREAQTASGPLPRPIAQPSAQPSATAFDEPAAARRPPPPASTFAPAPMASTGHQRLEPAWAPAPATASRFAAKSDPKPDLAAAASSPVVASPVVASPVVASPVVASPVAASAAAASRAGGTPAAAKPLVPEAPIALDVPEPAALDDVPPSPAAEIVAAFASRRTAAIAAATAGSLKPAPGLAAKNPAAAEAALVGPMAPGDATGARPGLARPAVPRPAVSPSRDPLPFPVKSPAGAAKGLGSSLALAKAVKTAGAAVTAPGILGARRERNVVPLPTANTAEARDATRPASAKPGLGLGNRMVAVKGKPRYLGLILTVILLLLLAAVAAWSSFFIGANTTTGTGAGTLPATSQSSGAPAKPDTQTVSGTANAPVPARPDPTAAAPDATAAVPQNLTPEPNVAATAGVTPAAKAITAPETTATSATAPPPDATAAAAAAKTATAAAAAPTDVTTTTAATGAATATAAAANASGTGAASPDAAATASVTPTPPIPPTTAGAPPATTTASTLLAPTAPTTGQIAPVPAAISASTPRAPTAPTTGQIAPVPAALPVPEPAPKTEVATSSAALQTRPAAAATGAQDQIVLASADQPPRVPDPTAVPAVAAGVDASPAAEPPPPPYGMVYKFDAQGQIIPTPEGIVTPEGVLLIAGKPKPVPPERPASLAPAPVVVAPPAPDGQSTVAAAVAAAVADTPAVPAPPAQASSDTAAAASTASASTAAAPAIAAPATAAATAATVSAPVAPDSTATASTAAAASPASSAPATAGSTAASPVTAASDAAAPIASTSTAPTLVAPAADAVPARLPQDRSLRGKHPRTRPAGLTPPAAQQGLATDGTTAAPQVAGLHPQARPDGLPVPASPLASNTGADAVAASASLASTGMALMTSPLPVKRPAGLNRAVDSAVAAALNQPAAEKPAAQKPAAPQPAAPQPDVQVAVAASDAQVEPDTNGPAPNLPTNASVAKQATTRHALNTNRVALLAVFGTPSTRFAMIRQANGAVKKVQVGDAVDGGRIAAISETSVQYQKGGQIVTLSLPTG